ncbi:hypothetical protein BJ322DRAFT_1022266 [Thelephora terrestris]|uniref:Uncharacterized protein n=1 Tax=Thelephora terrestris TaxID=56493 RepID=A0A9P6HAN3_9AGAM|nr:hypothetical protein BJ322DRAFT_1022266 [Thelephora terrestris]
MALYLDNVLADPELDPLHHCQIDKVNFLFETKGILNVPIYYMCPLRKQDVPVWSEFAGTSPHWDSNIQSPRRESPPKQPADGPFFPEGHCLISAQTNGVPRFDNVAFQLKLGYVTVGWLSVVPAHGDGCILLSSTGIDPKECLTYIENSADRIHRSAVTVKHIHQASARENEPLTAFQKQVPVHALRTDELFHRRVLSAAQSSQDSRGSSGNTKLTLSAKETPENVRNLTSSRRKWKWETCQIRANCQCHSKIPGSARLRTE